MKKNKGFTLMELVVSMAIIGTLAAFAIPSYLETNEKAKVEKTIDNMQAMTNAVGRRIQELSMDFSDVNIVENSTAAAVTDSTDIIFYYMNGQLTNETFGKIFPSGVPKSPYEDNNYNYVSITGQYEYMRETNGHIRVNVTNLPGLLLIDPIDEELFVQTYY